MRITVNLEDDTAASYAAYCGWQPEIPDPESRGSRRRGHHDRESGHCREAQAWTAAAAAGADAHDTDAQMRDFHETRQAARAKADK